MYLTRAEEKTDDPLLTEEMLGDREDWADRWNVFLIRLKIFQTGGQQRRGCWVNSAKKQVGNESKKTIYNTTPRPDQTFCRLYLERDSFWARLWSPADCLASLSLIIRAAAKAMTELQLLCVLFYSLLITRNCYNVTTQKIGNSKSSNHNISSWSHNINDKH